MEEIFEKIIEKLEELKSRYEYLYKNCNEESVIQYDLGRHDGILKAIEIVKQEAENYNNGWISCSEQLPEPFENVLISTNEGGRAIGHRCPNQAYGRYYDLHGSAIDNVVAWQPLPEPYPKGE